MTETVRIAVDEDEVREVCTLIWTWLERRAELPAHLRAQLLELVYGDEPTFTFEPVAANSVGVSLEAVPTPRAMALIAQLRMRL